MKRTPVRVLLALVALTAVIVVSGCTSRTPSAPSRTGDPLAASRALVDDRLDALDAAIAEWAAADSLDAVSISAEATRNLVVGPAGPGYGDANGDGTVSGEVTIGLLPGLGGEPGLIATDPARECVSPDVLGGSWSDPSARWAQAVTAAEEWTPANNPFPTLASHPLRIYGWSTLALQSNDLADAVEFAGHADIHADVTRRGLSSC